MGTNRRVVITGIGPVSTMGIGRKEFWKNLLAMKPVIHPIPSVFEKKYSFNSRFYIPYPEFTIEEFGIPGKYNIIMGEPAKLAVVCAKLALEDAGYKIKDGTITPQGIVDNAEIILGIGVGNLYDASKAFLAHVFQHIPEIFESNQISSKFNRMTVPLIMNNSASGWVSVFFGIKGANFTLSSACSSGTYAVGEAFRKIKEGHVKVVLTGGIECMKDGHGCFMRGFDSLGTLTRSEDGKPMPFSNKRSGFLFSEGAGCILILEELELALERGATIYAEIIDFNANSDAYNIIQIEPSGNQINQLIRKTIGEKKIDYFNTHGTGTVLNDETEYNVIREIFGNKKNQPIINSTKGILGHTIGASGALEIAVTSLSIHKAQVHANLTEDPITNLNLALDTLDLEINYALSTSYGFGGHNSAVLLKNYKFEKRK